MKPTKILFVCTGNVFRSMIAEYCLKKYLEINKIKNIEVASVGITGNNPQNILREVKEELMVLDIDCSKHRRRKLNQEHITTFNLIVSMAENHQKYIKEKFNYKSPLFYEITHNKKVPVKDNFEALDDTNGFLEEMYDRQMVRNIWRDIPFFVKNYMKFLKK